LEPAPAGASADDVPAGDAEPADASVTAEEVEPEVESIAVDVEPDEAEGADPPSSTNGSGKGDGEDSEVDRAAVVRELAGLFDDKPRPSRQPRGENEKLPPPKRVEDDEHITKGLINRLIDGVKGL
jgi:hypothetical protein